MGYGLKLLNQVCRLFGSCGYVVSPGQICDAPLSQQHYKRRILGRVFTLEVLGSEKYGSEMMLFNKAFDLWRYLRPVPSHDQSLTNCPSP